MEYGYLDFSGIRTSSAKGRVNLVRIDTLKSALNFQLMIKE